MIDSGAEVVASVNAVGEHVAGLNKVAGARIAEFDLDIDGGAKNRLVIDAVVKIGDADTKLLLDAFLEIVEAVCRGVLVINIEAEDDGEGLVDEAAVDEAEDLGLGDALDAVILVAMDRFFVIHDGGVDAALVNDTAKRFVVF